MLLLGGEIAYHRYQVYQVVIIGIFISLGSISKIINV